MKKAFKKSLAVIMAVVMMLTAAPLSGFVGLDFPNLFDFKAEAATEGYYTYTITNGEATITDCDTAIKGNITIPSTLGGYPVVCIANSAFGGCYGITSITIPGSVTSIGNSALRGCVNLTNITVNASNDYYSNDSHGVLFNKNKTELIAYPEGNTRSSYAIPNAVETIGNYAFSKCYYLTNVNFSNSVKTIGFRSFFECYNITNLTLGDSVTDIGEYAFSGCRGLESINIPDSLTNVDVGAFDGCIALKNVVFGKGIKTIQNNVFWDCKKLEYVHIPSSVTQIKRDILAYTSAYICSDKAGGYVEEYAKQYGYTFKVCGHTSTTPDIPDTPDEPEIEAIASGACGDNLNWVLEKNGKLSITGSGEMTYYFGSGSAPWYEYKDSIKKVVIEEGATNISGYAFCDCANLTDITIPDSVTHIGDSAFWYCTSLSNVRLPDGMIYLGSCAFYGCSSLTSITIPSGVMNIFDSTFCACTNLETVNIIDGKRGDSEAPYIGEEAFWGCSKLSSIVIPGKIASIGDNAFRYCYSLESVIINSGVVSIGRHAFGGSDNRIYMHIPSTVTSIESGNISSYDQYICSNTANCYAKTYADENGIDFKLCDHTSSEPDVPDIPDEPDTPDVPDIPDEPDTPDVPDEPIASGTCGELTWVIDSEGVLTISGTGAIPDYSSSDTFAPWYEYRNSIKKLVIGDGVTVIGKSAFWGLTAIIEVVISTSVTEIRDGAFEQCTSLVKFIVDAANAYYSTDSYGVLFNKDKTILIQYPIGNTRTSYTIPSTVLIIYDWAFSYCEHIVKITMGNSVVSIGNGAFRNCIKLKDITLSNKLKSLGSWVFSFCESLVNINLPDSITDIGICAFSGCIALESVKLPSTITYIANSMFSDCTALVNIVIPSSVTVIGELAFARCTSLISIILPEGVIEIMERAFSDCISLRSITLPSSLLRILSYAFERCYVLTNIFYSGTPEQWYAINISTENNDPLFNQNIWWSWVDIELTIKIIRPSKTTINYGDTLVLYIGEMVIPEGMKVAWFVDGAGVATSVSEDGLECRVTSIASGKVTISAKLVDENGEPVMNADGEEILDEITIFSKAGFWQKLVSFFKNLFGVNRIIY